MDSPAQNGDGLKPTHGGYRPCAPYGEKSVEDTPWGVVAQSVGILCLIEVRKTALSLQKPRNAGVKKLASPLH